MEQHADLDLLAFQDWPCRVVSSGQHMYALTICDDTAEDPCKRQKDLLLGVLWTRLACRTATQF